MFHLGEDHRDRPPRHMSDDQDSRRASSRGIIPRAKIKTVKMTFVIVFGEYIYIIFYATTCRYRLINFYQIKQFNST